MKRPGAIGFVALMLVLSILYAWFRLSPELGNWENPTTIITVETAKHVVTPSMAEASRGMVFRQAPAFTLKATDGAEERAGNNFPFFLRFRTVARSQFCGDSSPASCPGAPLVSREEPPHHCSAGGATAPTGSSSAKPGAFAREQRRRFLSHG